MDSSSDDQLQSDYSRNVANTLMLLAARRSSLVVDTYLSWLLAGAGAFIGLLISNLDKVSKYLSPGTVKAAAITFLIAAVLGAAEKYLASVVQGSAEGGKEAAELAKEAANDDIPLDLELVYREFEGATYPLTRWIMRKSRVAFRASSPTTVGQRLSRQAQVQSFLAMAVTALVFVSVVIVVAGLGG